MPILPRLAPFEYSVLTRTSYLSIQVEMTRPGRTVAPSADAADQKLLEAKYRIFLESIDIQKKWRKQMEDASN